MPFNGSGVFQRVRNWVADATAGIKIRADFHDSEDDGFADGLSNCITRDGQSTITQNIPMNNHRLTGLADPVNSQDAATKHSTEVYTNNRVLRSGDYMSGPLQSNPSSGITSPSHAGSIIISGDTGNAAMSFVANGVFGANFGIAHDGNFYMGGWTHGTNAYKFWTTRDFTTPPGASGAVTDARWIYIGDIPVTWGGVINEPANGGVMTGLFLTSASGGVSAIRLRGLQLFVGYWYSIAYA